MAVSVVWYNGMIGVMCKFVRENHVITLCSWWRISASFSQKRPRCANWQSPQNCPPCCSTSQEPCSSRSSSIISLPPKPDRTPQISCIECAHDICPSSKNSRAKCWKESSPSAIGEEWTWISQWCTCQKTCRKKRTSRTLPLEEGPPPLTRGTVKWGYFPWGPAS